MMPIAVYEMDYWRTRGKILQFSEGRLCIIRVYELQEWLRHEFVEAGYNQWVWGESARRYDEPYLSLGRRF